MRSKLIATGAGVAAATVTLWGVDAVASVGSTAVGAAVVAGVLAGRAVSVGLDRLVAAHRDIDATQADAMAGAPIMHWRFDPQRQGQAILDVATDAQVRL